MKQILLMCCLPFIGLTACQKDEIMSYNPVPGTNVSMEELRDTITSTNFLPDFFDDEDINKWSKWKPVKSSLLFGLTEEGLRNLNCGLIIPKSNSILNLAAIMSKLNWDWAYDRPSATDPKRLEDFIHYRPDAINPSHSSTLEGNYIDGEITQYQGRFGFGSDVGIDDFPNMSIDFGNMKNLLFGLAVLNESASSVVRWVTGHDVVSSSDANSIATIPLSGLEGTYKMMPFLTSAHKENMNDVPNGGTEYFGLPQVPTTFKIISKSQAFVVSGNGTYSIHSRMGTFNLGIQNNSKYTIKVTAADGKFKYEGNPPTTPVDTYIGEKQVLIPSISSIAPGEFKNVPVRATNIGDGSTPMYFYAMVTVTYNGNKTVPSTIQVKLNMIN